MKVKATSLIKNSGLNSKLKKYSRILKEYEKLSSLNKKSDLKLTTTSTICQLRNISALGGPKKRLKGEGSTLAGFYLLKMFV